MQIKNTKHILSKVTFHIWFLSSLFYLILSNTFLELYFLDKPLIILFWFSIFFISNSLLEVRFTIFYLRLKVEIKFVLVYKKLE